MTARLTLLKNALPILGFTATKALRLAREGELPSTKIGGLWYLVDLEQWLDARAAVEPQSPKGEMARRDIGRQAIAGVEELMPTTRRF